MLTLIFVNVTGFLKEFFLIKKKFILASLTSRLSGIRVCHRKKGCQKVLGLTFGSGFSLEGMSWFRVGSSSQVLQACKKVGADFWLGVSLKILKIAAQQAFGSGFLEGGCYSSFKFKNFIFKFLF